MNCNHKIETEMLEFIKFEIKYRVRRPVTYIYFAILFTLAFVATSTDIVTAGGSGGKAMENAPIVIAVVMSTFSIFATFIVSAVMGVPVLRDFDHQVEAMIFTTPVKKFNYLAGKYLGSLLTTLFIVSGILAGTMMGQVIPWPWHDYTDKLMPFTLMAYLNPFLVFVIPNTFIMGSIFFMGGTLGKRMVVVYAQGILLFMGYMVASQFLSELDNKELASLIDPFGFGAFEVTTQYWTVAEQNTKLFSFSGLILQNRLVWFAIALLSLLFTFLRFSYQLRDGRKRSKTENTPIKVDDVVAIPVVHQVFEWRASLIQLVSLSRFYLKWIVKQGPFLFIALAGMIFVFVIAFLSGTSAYDVELHMTSSRVVSMITGAFSLFFVIIVVFYTGEIVWKERDAKINSIYDAMPYPNFVVLASKGVGLVLMSIFLLSLLMFCGVIIQLIKGYSFIEWHIYFMTLFVDTLSVMTLYIILGLFIQTIANHKFLGFGLMCIFYISFLVLDELGVEHSMFFFARANLGRYSEMNEYGHALTSFSWFNIYWFGLGGLLYAVAILMAVRGMDTNFSKRILLGKLRLNRQAALTIAAALLIFLSSGAFIFYNANILNKYENSEEVLKQLAAYENELKQYEFIPQPKITSTYVEVDVFPFSRDFQAHGYYTLRNKSSRDISEIHIQKSIDDQVKTQIEFDRKAGVKENWDQFNYVIYQLTEPLAPGDSICLNFELTFNTRGFKESGSNNDVVFNGTFFNNIAYFPGIGYNSQFEIAGDDDRKDQGFPEKERMLERDDPRGIAQSLFGDDADKIRFEIIVSTDTSQIAVAPGYLQKQWEEGNRSFFHYRMDTPMVNFYSIISADYEIIKDTWTPPVDTLPEVNLEIYYHKGHEYNTNRMMKGMKESLTYYTNEFSPFQFRQLRILEFPQYRTFAQSFANTVPFSEGIGFIQNITANDVDLPFYVTAHEVAHQWWGHQVTEANVKGNAMLSETLSQYSALMVMKKNYPPEIIKEFLRHELDTYLRGRTFERKKEMPLELVEGQGYIHYRKGSLIMYALQDYVGEDSVNATLKRFIKDWAFKESPYPTSADLIDYYRQVTPDTLQHIIDDMFKYITLYENKTMEATYEKVGDQYKVSLSVDAIKYRADSLGVESIVPINDWIDVGVFTEDSDGKEKLIYLQKHKITEKDNAIEILVDDLPVKAGIDPINKLIDRNPDDNVKGVSEKAAA